jgi:hypothetical protein
MAKCSYCGKDRLDDSMLKDGNNIFCDNLCRHSFDKNGGNPKKGIEMAQTPVASVKKSQKNTALTVGAIVSAIVAALVGQFTTNFMQLDFSKLTQYKSPDNSFSVMLPKKVDKQNQTINTQLGPINAYMFNAKLKYQEFTIAYSEYPDSFVKVTDPKTLLDGSRDGAVRNIQGQLLSETLIDIDGNPGRELRIEGPQKMVLKSRMYLVKNRLYQIMVVSKPDHAFDKKIDEVFNSFKITGLNKTGT